MKLDYRSLEGASKDDSSVCALAKQAIELIFGLVNTIHLKEPLELNVGDLRHLALLTSLGWALFLRRGTVGLEIEFSKQIKEGWDGLRVVFQLEEKFILRLIDHTQSHILVLG